MNHLTFPGATWNEQHAGFAIKAPHGCCNGGFFSMGFNGWIVRKKEAMNELNFWSVWSVFGLTWYTPEDQHGTCPHGGLFQIIFLSFHGWNPGVSSFVVATPQERLGLKARWIGMEPKSKSQWNPGRVRGTAGWLLFLEIYHRGFLSWFLDPYYP